MRILIAGLGSIGRRHLRNLVSLGEKDIILYRTHTSTQPDNEMHDFPVELDLKKAFIEKPDAVIISNPTALHMAVAEQAAKANSHIFLEKPISHSLESLMPFETALKSSSSVVFTGYQFRFNPGLEAIKKIISNEEIGRPISFQCHWGEYLPGWHPWEDYRTSYAANQDLGGGVVLTLSHPLDYLRWIFGEIRELYAVTGKFSDLEVNCEDTADVLMTYANGVSGGLHLNYYQQPKKHELSIICTHGTIFWEYENSGIRIQKASGEIIETGAKHIYERNQMYLDEMSHFLDVCKNGIKPICGYKDGRKALQIAWGILQSGRYHERVIFED
ncbi:MAG: Gfo/Idh/MocA family oxidoreductase [Pelolinea sp.]|nr:Gfo/Idh/MocA family oxidoreductase [Pelolinea sp.]